jgi:hypothetical protein
MLLDLEYKYSAICIVYYYYFIRLLDVILVVILAVVISMPLYLWSRYILTTL